MEDEQLASETAIRRSVRMITSFFFFYFIIVLLFRFFCFFLVCQIPYCRFCTQKRTRAQTRAKDEQAPSLPQGKAANSTRRANSVNEDAAADDDVEGEEREESSDDFEESGSRAKRNRATDGASASAGKLNLRLIGMIELLS